MKLENAWKNGLKNIGFKVEMLTSGQGCLMDINVTYFYCDVDEKGIMTDVNNCDI